MPVLGFFWTSILRFVSRFKKGILIGDRHQGHSRDIVEPLEPAIEPERTGGVDSFQTLGPDLRLDEPFDLPGNRLPARQFDQKLDALSTIASTERTWTRMVGGVSCARAVPVSGSRKSARQPIVRFSMRTPFPGPGGGLVASLSFLRVLCATLRFESHLDFETQRKDREETGVSRSIPACPRMRLAGANSNTHSPGGKKVNMYPL